MADAVLYEASDGSAYKGFFERLCTDDPALPAAGAKEFRLRRVGRNTLSAIMRLGRAMAET